MASQHRSADTGHPDVITGETRASGGSWLAGSKGAAGSFSSNAVRRVLVAKLRSALPRIEAE